jgi:sphingomyelin phosphodiesterase acid-like 3
MAVFLSLALALLTILPLTGAARAQGAPLQPGPGEGLFLIVTDIHFDPFTVPSLVPQLDQSPVSAWPAIFSGNAGGDVAGYGDDAGYILTKSAVEAAAAQGMSYDYVLYTGDHLSHRFNDHYNRYAGGNPQGVASFAIKTTQYVSQLLSDSFGGIPVFGVLGNEDSACGDYQVEPDGGYLAGVGTRWATLSHQPARFGEFHKYGAYKVAHPTVPDQDIIGLNNIYWSRSYSDNCNPAGGDPGSEMMSWLDRQLAETQQAGRKAQILMHIPPGGDARDTAHHIHETQSDDRENSCDSDIALFWHDRFLKRFQTMMRSYSGTVDYTFSGHTHMDAFTVISDASGTPIIANQITPSVSPYFGNNPAFAVFLYDRTSGDILDSATFYASNLEEASGQGSGTEPDWQLEYTYRDTYNVKDLSAASRAELAARLESDAGLRRRFTDLYAGSLKARYENQNAINQYNDWTPFGCSFTAVSWQAFEACVCDRR